MATYYVSKDGNNSNNGTTPELGKLTIQAMLDALPAGTHTIEVGAGTYEEGTDLRFDTNQASKHITIQPYQGASVVITNTGINHGVLLFTGFTNGSATLNDLTISVTNSVYCASQASPSSHLYLNNCTLINTTSNGSGIGLLGGSGPTTGDVIITGGSITVPRRISYLGSSVRNFRVVGVTCTASQSDAGIMIWANNCKMTSAKWVDCVFNLPATSSTKSGSITGQAPASYIDYVGFVGCSGTLGKFFFQEEYVRRFEMSDCTFTCGLTSGDVFMACGKEISSNPAQEVVNENPYEAIIVRNNNLTFTGATNTHCMIYAVGALGLRLLDNVIKVTNSSATYHVVLKTNNAVIRGNKIYAPNIPLYLAGSNDCTVEYNTVYAPSGSAFLIDANQHRTLGETYGQAKRNVIRCNIFAAANGIAFTQDSSSDDPSQNWMTHCDSNLYWRGTDGIVHGTKGQTTTRAGTAANLVSAWQAAGVPIGDWSYVNDANSIIADPNLNTDVNSPSFLNVPAGSRAAVGKQTAWGAYHPKSHVGLL